MKAQDAILAVGLPTLAGGVVVIARRRTLARRALADRLERADTRARRAVRLETSLERRRLAADIDGLVRADVERIAALVREATRVAGTDPHDGLLGVLERVRATAEEALEALGRLLGAIDPADPPPGPGAPVPSLPDELAALRSRGVAVRSVERGDPDLTPPGALVAASRLVRDALAGDPPRAAPVRLRIEHRPNGLEVRLSAHGRLPPALADPEALVALRERVRLHGGTFGARQGLARWRVRATLPSGAVTTARLDRWDPAIVDAALAALCAGIALIDVTVLPTDRPALGFLMATASVAAPIAFRRRAPLTACLCSAVGLVSGAVVGALPHGPEAPAFVLTLVPFAAASHAATVPRALAGVAITTAGAVGAAALRLRRPGWPTETDLLLLAGYGTLIGAAASFTRHHRGRALALAIDEEELAERHPDLVRGAVAAERRRVAHDLHDVVSHAISLGGVLAGAAAAQTRTGDRAAAGATLRALEGVAAQARHDLRRLEAALEPVGEAHGDGLASLHELAEQARAAGHVVTVDVRLRPETALPGPVAGCVHRAVQEALTNARRHAGAPATSVTVDEDGATLGVEIRSLPALHASPGAGTGRGLVAMRERAEALGGEAEAGPEPDGGYRVVVRLPLSSPDSPGRTRPVS